MDPFDFSGLNPDGVWNRFTNEAGKFIKGMGGGPKGPTPPAAASPPPAAPGGLAVRPPVQTINTNLNVPGGRGLTLGKGNLAVLGLGLAEAALANSGTEYGDRVKQARADFNQAEEDALDFGMSAWNGLFGRGKGGRKASGTKVTIDGKTYDTGFHSQELAELRKKYPGGGNAGQAQSVDPSKSSYIAPTQAPQAPPSPSPGPTTGRNTSDPTGQSNAKGTQMGSRSASYEDVMKYLGPYAAQYVQQPLNSSALPRTTPGERQQASDVPNRTYTLGPDGNYTQAGSPKYLDEDGNILPGYSRETVIGPDGVETSTVTGPFPADRSQTVTTISPDDPIAAQAFGQDWVDKYGSRNSGSSSKVITPDDPIAAKAFGQDWVDANKSKPNYTVIQPNDPIAAKAFGQDWG